MRISIFGLGYVGTVSAACLAKEGHTVVGVDINQDKIDLINSGQSPIIEKDIGEIIKEMQEKERLSATAHVSKAIYSSDVSMVCVGTPSQHNGSLDLRYVSRICGQIGTVLKTKKDYHLVVIRSTMLPGSMHDIVIPTLEKFSYKKAGKDFGICTNPEFLREGTAVYDFFSPPKTVIGEINERSGDILEKLYKDFDAPIIRTNLETSEMVKYADNVWHALKIGFANEIGNICKNINIDAHKVMDIFCKDEKLNLSSYYLRPGFAFGGSCLPKDVRALTYKAKNLDLDLPILNSILPSNELQIKKGMDMIIKKEKKNIGILGISFKAGTDDLRESPIVEIIERLIGKGYEVRIYDKNVNLARIGGANRDYILNHIPHISGLMVESIEEVVKHADVIVIGNKAHEFNSINNIVQKNQSVVDFVRIDDIDISGFEYDGICW